MRDSNKKFIEKTTFDSFIVKMKNFILCFIFFIYPISKIFSEPLSPIYIIYGSSQVLYKYCSLIPYENFFPTSCDLEFNSNKKIINFRHSSSFSFSDNGFAFGYEKSNIGTNIVSTGYGVKKEKLSFGSSLKIFLQNNPALHLNVSSSLHINETFDKCIFSINNISLIQTEKCVPQILVDITGKILDKPDFHYNVLILTDIFSKPIINNPVTAKLDLSGKIGLRSYFIYALGYQINYSERSLSNIVNISIGSMASILEKGVGLLFGYSVDLNRKVNTIQCNLSFNPFKYRDVTAPIVAMDIKCEEKNKAGYYFTLKCDDNNGSGLKSWTLVISDQPSKNGRILRIFSGGFPIPSTVYWDKRDSRGEFIDKKEIFTRLVVVDNSKNVGFTPWVFLK